MSGKPRKPPRPETHPATSHQPPATCHQPPPSATSHLTPTPRARKRRHQMIRRQRRCKCSSATRNVSPMTPCLSPLAELLSELQDHNGLDLLPLARTDHHPGNNEECVVGKPMTTNHFANHTPGNNEYCRCKHMRHRRRQEDLGYTWTNTMFPTSGW